MAEKAYGDNNAVDEEPKVVGNNGTVKGNSTDVVQETKPSSKNDDS